MNLYRQSIALFGIVLPVLACGVLVALCFVLKSKALESFDTKTRLFKTYETNRLAALEIESKIALQLRQYPVARHRRSPARQGIPKDRL